MDRLPSSSEPIEDNLKKLKESWFDHLIQKKMITLFKSGLNFMPNTNAYNVLRSLSLDDVQTFVVLKGQNLDEHSKYFDGITKCVEKERGKTNSNV